MIVCEHGIGRDDRCPMCDRATIATLEAQLATLRAELDEAHADYAACAAAIGVEYTPEGHASHPGPRADVVAAIETAKREGTDREELQRSFDLRWDADMRAIERWQAVAPKARELIWPDHADLCVWLLEHWDAEKARADEWNAAHDRERARANSLATELAEEFRHCNNMDAHHKQKAAESRAAAAEARATRLAEALREIATAPARWSTCDRGVAFAQAGRWSADHARAALAEAGGSGT